MSMVKRATGKIEKFTNAEGEEVDDDDIDSDDDDYDDDDSKEDEL